MMLSINSFGYGKLSKCLRACSRARLLALARGGVGPLNQSYLKEWIAV